MIFGFWIFGFYDFCVVFAASADGSEAQELTSDSLIDVLIERSRSRSELGISTIDWPSF